MCGILTVVSKRNRFKELDITQALKTIEHRGPDGLQVERFIHGDFDVWMGHVRLAIIDLTSTGVQPMKAAGSAIVFNGEIYNCNQLRLDIPVNLLGTSDTEILLHGIRQEGQDFLKKCNGMFAISFFNGQTGQLIVARDRLGKKPLFIYQTDDLLILSSELKPIIELVPSQHIDQHSLNCFRQFGYVIGTDSIYKAIKKVPAAASACVNLGLGIIEPLKFRDYWDPIKSYSQTWKYSYEDAVERFLELLDDSCELRMMSDVPVGMFLSGGIDSSLVVTSLKKLGANVQVFTAKFEANGFDESDVAESLCRHLGLGLQILNVDEDSIAKQTALIPKFYDEPFADSSQIPLMAISELASKYVKVILTGDGGDEPFLGYPRYSYPMKISKYVSAIQMIPGAQKLLNMSLSASTFDPLIRMMFRGAKSSDIFIESKKNRLKNILNVSEVFEVYSLLHSVGGVPDSSAAIDMKNLLMETYSSYDWSALEGRSIEEFLSALDLIGYMKDDVLQKVDRGSMAYGLEIRSPLLDYRIVEFAQSLPSHFKCENGIHKKLLRDALARRAPKSITELPKKGFSVPLDKFITSNQDQLRGWIQFVESKWKAEYFK